MYFLFLFLKSETDNGKLTISSIFNFILVVYRLVQRLRRRSKCDVKSHFLVLVFLAQIVRRMNVDEGDKSGGREQEREQEQRDRGWDSFSSCLF